VSDLAWARRHNVDLYVIAPLGAMRLLDLCGYQEATVAIFSTVGPRGRSDSVYDFHALRPLVP
jgi:hypothetical protein